MLIFFNAEASGDSVAATAEFLRLLVDRRTATTLGPWTIAGNQK
jgi:hypothetical protein